MAEQRITTKPTVDALLENDYIFIDHEGSLRRVRKSDAGLASSADLQEFEESETAAREEFAESVTEQLAYKADIGGNYEDLTSGTSEQLLSTQSTEDQSPYLFRKSGGGKSIGNREIDTLVGGSVVWNQLVPTEKRNFTSETSDTKNYFSFQLRSAISPYTSYWSQNISAPMLFEKIVTANAGTTSAQFLHNGSQRNINIAQFNCDMFANHKYLFSVDIKGADVQTVGGLIVNNIQLHDLTAMFGTTIADRLYQMDQATAGSGVALFRSWFLKEYYAYNKGTLMSVKTSAHEMVGKNQFDGVWERGLINGTTGQNVANSSTIRSKNYIPVKGGSKICGAFKDLPNNFVYLYEYKADKTYNLTSYETLRNGSITLKEDTAFVRVRADDLIANIDENPLYMLQYGDTPTEYEPYVKHTYPLDPIELRGLPKLVDGAIQYDGDKYEADGTVTRRFGIVDLGTLNYTLESTSETRQVFKTTITSARTTSSATEPFAGMSTKFFAKTINDSWVAGDMAWRRTGAPDIALVTKSGEYASAAAFKTAMSGVYLVYELATPTTETADPFTSPQIVDAYGTERYVDERDVAVPVGHDTEYPEDLVAKLDGLPWDFSNLIAPTEKAYTATRNYTVGSYLIMDNTLYKVTAAIASGGTITVGTNVAATTIMAEIIAAL